MDAVDLKKRVGRLTLANQLTFLRLVAVPFFILAVLEARFGLALTIFVAAGVTDLLDGLVARASSGSAPHWARFSTRRPTSFSSRPRSSSSRSTPICSRRFR